MKSKKRSPEQIIKKLLRVGGRQDDRMRSELLEAEVCGNASAAQTLAAAWRSDYNHHRPHDSFAYQTPAEFAARCAVSAPAAPSL